MKAKILTVVIVFGLVGISRANLVNSNSIVQDDIEYYIQTDKSVYSLGEEVEMLYRITNLGQESITFTLPYNPVWNFWAETSGQCIWTGMYSKLAQVTDLVLEADESVELAR